MGEVERADLRQCEEAALLPEQNGVVKGKQVAEPNTRSARWDGGNNNLSAAISEAPNPEKTGLNKALDNLADAPLATWRRTSGFRPGRCKATRYESSHRNGDLSTLQFGRLYGIISHRNCISGLLTA